MMREMIVSFALAGILALTPVVTDAQVTPPPGGQRNRMELERRLHLGFQRSIQTQLRLTEDEVQRLQEVLRTFQQERTALARAQASLRHKLRDPGLPDLEAGEAEALLDQMVQLQERELDLYRREQAELLQRLTPVQVLRFYRLRENLGRRIQQLREGRGRGGGVGRSTRFQSPSDGGGRGDLPVH